MEIKLLTTKEYLKEKKLSRTTLWRNIKDDKDTALKVSEKKLWFLPPEYEVVRTQEEEAEV